MDDLLDTAPCGFIVFTDEAVITQVNQTLLGWLGYLEEELVGRKMDAILTVANRIFYQTHFFPLIKLQGGAEEVFLTMRAKSGDDVPTLVNAIRKVHEKQPLNHAAVLPVRQRRKYEDEILAAKRQAESALKSNEALARTKLALEHLTKELDRKVAKLERKSAELARVSHILSHDLREAIRKISWQVEILQGETEDGKLPDDSSIATIRTACATADQLMKTLRDFVSLDMADEVLAEVDLGEIVADAFRQASANRGLSDAQLVCSNLPRIEGVRRQLVVLFRNLFDNAMKFRQLEQPPHIEVSTDIVQHNSFKATQGRYQWEDFVKIRLRDNGIGFDAKHSERVFDARTNVRTDAFGFGLGLATCRKVVENHQGNISVTSTPHRGTVFTILLPLRQE
jgi:phosphoserine phosphatase RsbU/P